MEKKLTINVIFVVEKWWKSWFEWSRVCNLWVSSTMCRNKLLWCGKDNRSSYSPSTVVYFTKNYQYFLKSRVL